MSGSLNKSVVGLCCYLSKGKGRFKLSSVEIVNSYRKLFWLSLNSLKYI